MFPCKFLNKKGEKSLKKLPLWQKFAYKPVSGIYNVRYKNSARNWAFSVNLDFKKMRKNVF
jgi:hypothetical protein